MEQDVSWIDNLSYPELQKELSKRNLKEKGKKEELRERLKQYEFKQIKEKSNPGDKGEVEMITEKLGVLQLQEFTVEGFLQTISFPPEKQKILVEEYSSLLTKLGFNNESAILTFSTIPITTLELLGIKEEHAELFVEAAKTWKERKDISQFYFGLPPLGEKSGSSSDPSENLDHLQAKLKQKNFQLLEDIKPRAFTSSIWTFKRTKEVLEWGSESDIQGYVKLVMDDAIAAAGLEGKVSCMNELGIFRVRPDIWIVLKGGFPIGVLEVKKPGKDVMNSERLHGQIFDYMIRLRNFFGQKHVFGIVSTYKEWRIYWLANQDCNEAAEATQVNFSSDQAIIQDIDTIPEWLEDSESNVEEVLIPPSQEKRILCGTGIIRYDEKHLPYLLVSVIIKMYCSPRVPVPLVDSARSYIQLNETSWYWVHFSNELNLSKMPSTNTKSLVLLRDLRGGVHGRVWLACSSSGSVCVIKFAQDRDNTDSLFHEQNIWKNVWKLPARIQTFCGQVALVMPFVKPCTEEERDDKDIQKSVLIAIERMAKEGYCHEDLSWRHVGLYKSKGEVAVVLFDVAKTSKVSDVMTAITNMKGALGLVNQRFSLLESAQ